MPEEQVVKQTSTVEKVDSNDPFIGELQKRLLNQSDLISSSTSGIEAGIGEAISGVEKARDASTKRIESQFGREISYQAEIGQEKEAQFLESRRGFATNTAAYSRLKQDTEKSLRDLEQRKQEMILQGEANAASQISALQVQQLQFQQQAQQQVFNNLLATSNFGLEVAREKRIDETTRRQERQQIADIALQFGLPIDENDTLDTIVAKAAPFANERQRLDLENAKAKLRQTQLETQKILKGEEGMIDELTAQSLATAFRTGNTGFLSGIKSPKDSAKIFGFIQEQEEEELANVRSLADQIVSSGGTMRDFERALEASDLQFANQADYDKFRAQVIAENADKFTKNPGLFKQYFNKDVARGAAIGTGVNAPAIGGATGFVGSKLFRRDKDKK